MAQASETSKRLEELKALDSRLLNAAAYASHAIENKKFSLGQLTFLLHVREYGPEGITMSDLLAVLGKPEEEHSYVSRNANSMRAPKAKQGLVDYRPDARRPRFRRVFLTQLGIDVTDRILLILAGTAKFQEATGKLTISPEGKKDLTLMKSGKHASLTG